MIRGNVSTATRRLPATAATATRAGVRGTTRSHVVSADAAAGGRVSSASSRWLPSAGSMPESQPWGVVSVGRQRPTLERCSAPAAARDAGSPSCLCE